MNIFYVRFIFYYCQQFLFTLRVSSLLTPLNDNSVDIVNDERSFQFSPEARFTSPLQQKLKQNYRASRNCYAVKNRWKLLVFKRLLNELLVETEWSEVMLIMIWWFVWIKFIRSFLKISFLIHLFKRVPLKFQLQWKNCPFSIDRYHYGSTVLLTSIFFSSEIVIFFFSEIWFFFLPFFVKTCKIKV